MHGPSTEWEVNKELEEKKTRLGLILFIIYTIIYVAFIYINVSHNSLMSVSVGSLNVAIVFGFMLILLAFLFACFYNQYSTKLEKESAKEKQ